MHDLHIPGLIIVTIISAGACWALTFIVSRLSTSLSILDIPDDRKIHKKNIPCIGGLAFYITGCLILALLIRFYPDLYIFRTEIKYLIIGSAVICALGIWDDVRGSGAVPKLVIQSLIGIMMFFSGFSIEEITVPLVGKIYLGYAGIFVTIFWYCLLINAINLIDGLDGLATGLTIIAAVTILVISYSWSQPLSIILAVIIIGTGIGFLPHNFYPAKIFLGDTGSMLLGFWLASVSLLTSTKAPALLTLFIPVIAIGLPVFDTIFAFLRRVGHGEHPFRADKRHIHHRLLALGYSHPHSVFLLYVSSMYLGLTAYLLSLSSSYVTFLTLLLLVLGCILIVDILRHKPNSM